MVFFFHKAKKQMQATIFIIALFVVLSTSATNSTTHHGEEQPLAGFHFSMYNIETVQQVNTNITNRPNISNYFQNCTNGYKLLAQVGDVSREFKLVKISCQQVFLFKSYTVPPIMNNKLQSTTVSKAIFETIPWTHRKG